MQTPFLISVYFVLMVNLLLKKDYAIAQKLVTNPQPLFEATVVEGSTFEGDAEDDGDDCLDGCDFLIDFKDGYHDTSQPIIQARSPYFITVDESPNEFDIISGDGDGIIDDNMLNSSTLYHGEESFQYIHDIDNGVELPVDKFDVDTNDVNTPNEMSGGGIPVSEGTAAWTSNEFDNFIKFVQNANAESDKFESSGESTNVHLDVFDNYHGINQTGSGEALVMTKSSVSQQELTEDGPGGSASIRFLPEEFPSDTRNNTEESIGDVGKDIVSVRQAIPAASSEKVISDPMSVDLAKVAREYEVQQRHACFPNNPCQLEENCRVESGSNLQIAICLCTCMNGGVCPASDGRCDCPVGFAGRNCEFPLGYDRVERSLTSGRSAAPGESKDAISPKSTFIIVSSLAAVLLTSCLISFLFWKFNKRQSPPHVV